LAAGFAVWGLIMWGFLGRQIQEDPVFWAGLFGVMLVIMTPLLFRPLGDFIAARPRTVFRVGVGICVVGITTLIAVPLFVANKIPLPSDDSIKLAVMGLFLFMLIGFSLTTMPRNIAALRRFQRAAAAPKTEQQIAKQRAFRGTRQAVSAVGETVRDFGPFLRVMGPWIVLLWAAPFVGLRLSTYEEIGPGLFGADFHSISRGTQALNELGPSSLVAVLAYPFALVTWHRHIIAKRAPDAIHGSSVMAALRYFWRLYMMLLMFPILLGLVANVTLRVAHWFGVSISFTVALALGGLFFLLIIFTFSSYALALPAVAVGNRDFVGMDSQRVTLPFRNSFAAGLMLSLLPFGLLSWFSWLALTKAGLTGAELSLADYAPYLAPIALQFLALASGATYLSRVYGDHALATSADVAAATAVAGE